MVFIKAVNEFVNEIVLMFCQHSTVGLKDAMQI